MRSEFHIELAIPGTKVVMSGRGSSRTDAFVVTKESIQGMYSAPPVKTTLVERQTGNGAHDVSDGNILYSARTVTIPFAIIVASHNDLADARTRLGRLMSHSLVRLTVYDGDHVWYIEGYVQPEYSDLPDEYVDTGTLTLVCPKPERLSTKTKSAVIQPYSGDSGGLQFNEGLMFPLNFGETQPINNVMTMSNHGSYTATPRIYINGNFPNGCVLYWNRSDGRTGQLEYLGYIGGAQVVLDSRDRTATVGGLDRTPSLGGRAFPVIPPNGSVTVALMSGGTGWVSMEAHDTWI